MKKFIIGALFLATVIFLTSWLQPEVSASPNHKAVFLVDQETYIVDDQASVMDVAPFVEKDRVYIPMRYLANALGVPDSAVTWDSAGQAVTFTLDGVFVRLTVGDVKLRLGEKDKVMDVAPLLREDRVFLPARWVSEAVGYEVKWDDVSRAVLVGPPGDLPQPPSGGSAVLPAVGSFENLKNLLAKVQVESGRELYNMKTEDAQAQKSSAVTSAPAGAGAGPWAADYSKTNVQVEGVDEADIVKTDGTYIYQVNGQRVVIARAYPAGEMKVVSSLDFTEKGFTPQEMYVDDKCLVVIGQARSWDEPAIGLMGREVAKVMPTIMPPRYQQEKVKAILYDISDKSGIKQVRELEINGSYVSSRKVGSALYLAASKRIYYYLNKEGEDIRPSYRDSVVKDDFIEIDYPEIRCFPGFSQPNYLVVAGINLDRPEEKANVSTYLGSGENIYASTQNLYVAVTNNKFSATGGVFGPVRPLPVERKNDTRVYKFAMSGGKLTYSGSGEVPGTVLNQFSMDESGGYFRIATTKGEVWRTDEYTSKNNVYVLDDSLKVAGKIEDIAPGEKIYSVRFLGDRAYMVTFKTVDPFFVIDLKDPQNPKILGALKIPGYSDYLHPYDENHIIGFGKDTIEVGQKDGEGKAAGNMAFYTGMKMAVFDVSDVQNPVEMFKEKIGGRGTDSEILHNHKALLFARDKNLLAIPVRVMEGGDSVMPGTSIPAYGKFTFQGAYVYNLDLASGFVLKGKITHLTSEDYLKAGDSWYGSEKNVERVLYINDTLYTLSQKYIKANSLDNLAEINTLEIK